MCGLPESDPIHSNGPHFQTVEDAGGAISWAERNLQVSERRRPRKRLAYMTGAKFGEALSDTAKTAKGSLSNV